MPDQENNQGSQTAETPTAGIDFAAMRDFELVGNEFVAPGSKVEEKKEVEKKEPEVDADGDPEPDEDLGKKEEQSAAEAEDSNKEEESEDAEEQEIELSEEEVFEALSERLGSYGIKSLDDLEAKLKIATEATPKFANEKQAKLFDYLSKYGGDDYGTGLQNYMRLQSIDDLSKLSPSDALKELFIQENPDLSKEDAELLFQDEFEKKYGGLADEDLDDNAKRLLKIKLDKEAKPAYEKLQDMKAKTAVTDNSKAQAEEYEAKRTEYLQSVDKTFEEFDRISFIPDEKDPDSQFNYDFSSEELEVVSNAMKDMDFHYKQMGWVDDKGAVDYKKMALDYSCMYNREKILAATLGHGKELGKEDLLKEMENRTPKKKESPASDKKNVQTRDEAFKEAVMNHPGLK